MSARTCGLSRASAFVPRARAAPSVAIRRLAFGSTYSSGRGAKCRSSSSSAPTNEACTDTSRLPLSVIANPGR